MHEHSFGKVPSSKQERSGQGVEPQHLGRMHHLLIRDQAKRWNQEFFGQKAALDQWVKDNIVYALEHCPAVMAMWSDSQHGPYALQNHRDAVLMQCVARKLEDLDDPAKIRLLEGNGAGAAQTQLKDYLGRTAYWAVCSPAWIGLDASALRQAAKKAGWVPIHLPSQVAHSIEETDSLRWAQNVRYPHSVAALHWMYQARQPNYKPWSAPRIKTSQPWADAQDVALAQLLLVHSDARPNHTWGAHEALPCLNNDEKATLQTLVMMHKDFDTWYELYDGIVAGHLPSLVVQDALVLPDLGM